jgi:signal transduction histidine kinase
MYNQLRNSPEAPTGEGKTLSIRLKVILPYLLLTVVVAITGVYVVTKLVANSLSERLTNQLLEAGRVVSDDFARQEVKHVESARILAFTRGLAEALSDGDRESVISLAKPTASGLGIEDLILIDSNGHEILHLIRGPDGSLQEVAQATGAGNLSIVQNLLAAKNPDSLPQRGLGINPVDGRYYYFTALPVPLGTQIAGVVVIGTSLDTILPYLKSTSLADIILYGENGRAIATTLGAVATDKTSLETLSIGGEDYLQIVSSNDLVHGENFSLDGRWYSLARGSLRVSNNRLGAFAVVLPLNFVLQAGAVSRNTYIVLFTGAMIAVVLIGYFISRLIINPLVSLVHTSRAIAGGDLKQRTGIRSGDEIGVLANTFDSMTENLQQRTIELEKTNRALEQMDKTKVSFISVSAHELRTPLTLIDGYAQMLRMQAKEKGDAELESLAQGILDGSHRMTDVVNSMLDVSRIDSKTLKVSPVELEPGVVVEKACRTFKTDLIERKLTLETRGLDGLPLIQADPDLLYKVFYHLLINAIKYTPDGGLIQVSGQAVKGDGGPEVEIIICDNGIGIDPQHHELIFEKFYQTGEVLLHSSGRTKFKGGGPGLGLAIARGIVEAHHGRIWVESSGYNEDSHPGSEFHVRLPVRGPSTQ